MAPRLPESSASEFAHVPQADGDPIFHVFGQYLASTNPKRVNVSIGAYRDAEGKPWVLPVVRKAESLLVADPTHDHEYLGMEGYARFVDASVRLVIGSDSVVEKEGRVAAVQTISGSGACRLAFEFLRNYGKNRKVYVSTPSWPNHVAIAVEAGLVTAPYRYWDAAKRGLDIDGMIEDLEAAAPGSIIVLHGCAHNPTGVDPTQPEWIRIADVCKRKQLFPFFDIAYQGFATGSLERDAWAARYFLDQGFEIFFAQSYSKNMGLYGERAGVLGCVMKDKEVHIFDSSAVLCLKLTVFDELRPPKTANHLKTQFARLTRAMFSNCPSHGSRIASLILNDPTLFAEWKENLLTMSGRIQKMREMIYHKLVALGTPGTWEHIKTQIGMFSYTGLTKSQCQALRSERAVFLLDSGRISVPGLNEENVGYFAESVDWAVRNGSFSSMGNAPSASSEPTDGYHVLGVNPGSPADLAGLEPHFDYIIACEGVELEPSTNPLAGALHRAIDRETVLHVYSSKRRSIRDVPIVPSKEYWSSGPENGLIGCSVRWCSYDGADEHIWHVLEIQPNSPAELAGLYPNTDYIIGTPSHPLPHRDDLFHLVESHIDRPLRLFVYNSVTDGTREVMMVPSRGWGGEGCLGAAVGYGYLHKIPTLSEKAGVKDVLAISPTRHFEHADQHDHGHGDQEHGHDHGNGVAHREDHTHGDVVHAHASNGGHTEDEREDGEGHDHSSLSVESHIHDAPSKMGDRSHQDATEFDDHSHSVHPSEKHNHSDVAPVPTNNHSQASLEVQHHDHAHNNHVHYLNLGSHDESSHSHGGHSNHDHHEYSHSVLAGTTDLLSGVLAATAPTGSAGR
ncbi:Aspartate aminotransferase, cytoplasmic [Gonapodya sp. JEL0774]|nr:Aspartate aminotransferase, cytoplasmic [Gonapodya sp. JEL0774]